MSCHWEESDTVVQEMYSNVSLSGVPTGSYDMIRLLLTSRNRSYLFA